MWQTYLQPRSIDEAVSYLAQYGVDARVVHGGTDLMFDLERRLRTPKVLIDLSRVPGLCYGVVRQTPAKTDALEYLAGVEVAPGSPAPKGMTRLQLPAARYAKFTHQGKVEHLDQTVNYVYSSWLARSGKRHTYGADLEFYGAQYQPKSDRSILHYAIPIA